MLTSTPEYSEVHQQNLAALANQTGAAAVIARRRRDRWTGIRRFVATVYNAISLRASKNTQQLPAEPETTA
jgi:hypothetical protein